jgi:hypothetical protein
MKTETADSKFIAALANHERLLQQVGLMKKQISESLNKCPIMIKAIDWDTPESERHELHDSKGLIKIHLWGAFNELTQGSYGMIRLDSDDQENYLTDPWNDETRCDHCYAAWRVIQDRKEVRQALGRARRAIRQLGKTAIRLTAESQ